jgi:2-C-methyl-D-erythritol 2,4-cyclodiphosphate synthase
MTRIGLGVDVHQFTSGRPLILGGVVVPYQFGLAGHSDADVLSHAVIDALLGAASLGDIGQHFPDTDPLYKDISSLVLLARVGKMITQKGFVVKNIDATLIMESPRMSPFIFHCCKNIATSLEIEIENVSVKATTTEALGAIGRREGIAALAVALIERPEKNAS